MKAVILNSGMGTRMGDLTKSHPKCMTMISDSDTIISYQLKRLMETGLDDVIITTGYLEKVLVQYIKSLNMPLNITFINNPLYDKTNYIYSIYCARDLLDDDILLLHGDLIFDKIVLEELLKRDTSCMKTSSTVPIPQKDFKALVQDGIVKAIGVDLLENSVEAQAFYKILKDDWKVWLDEIKLFCESGRTDCYAENAFNEVADKCQIYAYDAKDMLCTEIDDINDLAKVKAYLNINQGDNYE